jgi:hypothetical protein
MSDLVAQTEAQILAVRVGEGRPLNGRNVLVDYDPDWLRWFEREAELIRATREHVEGLVSLGCGSRAASYRHRAPH